jgi:hypothetical protein
MSAKIKNEHNCAANKKVQNKSELNLVAMGGIEPPTSAL